MNYSFVLLIALCLISLVFGALPEALPIPADRPQMKRWAEIRATKATRGSGVHSILPVPTNPVAVL